MYKRPTRARGLLLKIAGTVFLILGGVGVVLPLLPTTPFLLLAAVCYARSSERLYRWLLYNRWFGSYIRNWHEGYSAVVIVPFVLGKVALIIVAVCVSVHILSLPTLEPDA